MFEGVSPFKGDSGAIQAGAFLRVPHRQAGLRSAIGARAPVENFSIEGS